MQFSQIINVCINRVKSFDKLNKKQLPVLLGIRIVYYSPWT